MTSKMVSVLPLPHMLSGQDHLKSSWQIEFSLQTYHMIVSQIDIQNGFRAALTSHAVLLRSSKKISAD